MSFHENLALFLQQEKEKSLENHPSLAKEDQYKSNSIEDTLQLLEECKKEEKRGSFEKQLRSFLSFDEFQRLKLPTSTYPQFFKGLPLLYQREDPSSWCVKKDFQDLPMLKRRLLDKALWSLYAEQKIVGGRLVLLSWVVPGGLGDYFAAIEAARVIKKRYEKLQIDLFVITDQKATLYLPNEASFCFHQVGYFHEKKDWLPKPEWSQEHFNILKRADFLLEIPIPCPSLKPLLPTLSKNGSAPKVDLVREYGFISSTWLSCPPLSKSMGIHPLEMGIFIKEIYFEEALYLQILHRLGISFSSLAAYRKEKRAFFAYLYTEAGKEAFLHALLTYVLEERKGIDLFVHEMGWYLLHIEKICEEAKLYGISDLVFQTEERSLRIPIAPSGKTLRIIHTRVLEPKEFQTLLYFSEDFVGCRGDQSFSEALSAHKIYFYDGLHHAVSFLKDLVSFCQFYLPNFPTSCEYLRLFLKNMAYFWKEDPREWVDEEFFDYPCDETPKSIGRKMGALLKNPATKEGILKLNGLLREKQNVTSHLTALVGRAMIQKKAGHIEKKEEEMIRQVIGGKLSFSSMILQMRSLL